MKNMDYEKKYKEALNWMRELYPGLHGATKEDAEHYFPELKESKESKDERIRKAIVELVKRTPSSMFDADTVGKWIGASHDEILTYLEKQKEQPQEELVYRMNGLMQEYVKEGEDDAEKEHRLKCYQLFWDALEDADFFEQKEQKPSISIDQLKSLMLQYLQEAANEKEDSDIEADTDKWARKILGYDFKHKPLEVDEYKIIKKHITEDSLSSEVNKRLTECGWYVTDKKPVEWTELTWKDVNDLEEIMNEVHSDYRGGGIGQKSFGLEVLERFRYIKGDELDVKEQKPEWNEEDKKMLNLTIEWAEIMSNQFSFADVDPKDFRKIIVWLKSLKDRGDFTKSNANSPSEWSEEDKETIDLTIAVLKENLPNGYFKTNPANTLNMGAISTDELINRLKSLSPQPKQEWSEEDKAMIDDIIFSLPRMANGSIEILPSVAKSYSERLKSLKDRGNFPKSNTNSPSEWSEEDEKMRDNILRLLSCFVGTSECDSNPSLSTSYPAYQKEMDWLKSLPLNLKKKNEDVEKLCSNEWSEEDAEMYINVASSLRGYACGLENEEHKRHIKGLDWLENRFKSLRPQSKDEIHKGGIS